MNDGLRIKFHHGLGDTLMFRNVLALLDRQVRLCLHAHLGQSAVFHALPNIKVVEQPEAEPSYKNVRFAMENSLPCAGGHPTKTRVCMEHEFGLIRPDFKIRPLPLDNLEAVRSPAIEQTKGFVRGLGEYVVCHFQGTWSPERQNADEGSAHRTVQAVVARGYGVVLVNYDYIFHNPENQDFRFVDGDRVRSTYRVLPMEFESLWCLLRNAALFIGVDSGPLHAAVCFDIPSIYLKKGTNFERDFYDEGLERLTIVDTTKEDSVSEEILDAVLAPVSEPRVVVPSESVNPRSSRAQAEFLLGLYRRQAPELVETGVMHDAGRLGGRGMVYRTDAEVCYALIRTWRPDLVVDFCTGSGDVLSYALLALDRNRFGACLSADIANRHAVTEWLKSVALPMDRLLLCDERDIRELLPMIGPALRHKERILWLLDTNHEFEMGQWQLEHIIKPFRHKSVFAKDDVVAVNNRLESDMGAIYALREFICRHMEIVSTNAAFGAVSGLPCCEEPYRGAEGLATPSAIPFRPCRRNVDVQEQIRSLYPRWDGDANKMVFFWAPELLDWNART